MIAMIANLVLLHNDAENVEIFGNINGNKHKNCRTL